MFVVCTQSWQQSNPVDTVHVKQYVTENLLQYFIMQLEQEVDLILNGKNLMSTAVSDWTDKWVPAILKYGDTLTGKKATMLHDIQKKYEGM